MATIRRNPITGDIELIADTHNTPVLDFPDPSANFLNTGLPAAMPRFEADIMGATYGEIPLLRDQMRNVVFAPYPPPIIPVIQEVAPLPNPYMYELETEG